MLDALVLTYISLLHARMVAHVQELYSRFHSYVVRTCRSFKSLPHSYPLRFVLLSSVKKHWVNHFLVGSTTYQGCSDNYVKFDIFLMSYGADLELGMLVSHMSMSNIELMYCLNTTWECPLHNPVRLSQHQVMFIFLAIGKVWCRDTLIKGRSVYNRLSNDQV